MTFMRLLKGFPAKPGPWHIRAKDQPYYTNRAACGADLYTAFKSNRQTATELDADDRLCVKCRRATADVEIRSRMVSEADRRELHHFEAEKITLRYIHLVSADVEIRRQS